MVIVSHMYVVFICLLFLFSFLFCMFIVVQKCSQNLSVELTKYCWQKKVFLSIADQVHLLYILYCMITVKLAYHQMAIEYLTVRP